MGDVEAKKNVENALPQELSPAPVLSSSADLSIACDAFRLLAEGCRLQAQFLCKEAVEIYQSVPGHHYRSGWLLVQMGRCVCSALCSLSTYYAFQM
jgi:hypothetical protein